MACAVTGRDIAHVISALLHHCDHLTNGGIAGTNTTLNFVMEPNLVVTANFATNLFVGMAARYDGIFYLCSPSHPPKRIPG